MSRHQRYYSQNYSLVDNEQDFSYDYSRSNTPQPPEHDHSHDHDYQREHFPEELPSRTTKVGSFGYDDGHTSTLHPDGGRFWTHSRKILALTISGILLILILALGIGLGVGLKHKKGPPFTFTLLDNQVTNASAFTNGGASHQNVNETDTDATSDYHDTYTYYSGDWTKFPPKSEWKTFEYMWTSNLGVLQKSCSELGHGADMDNRTIQYIHDAIQNRANASLVDHRFILAVILQESKGCVKIKATDNGVTNPGIMQSHDGHEFDADYPWDSILAMVQDGTQGTGKGTGLVQALDYWGDAYTAARYYNSGQIAKSGNLSEAAGATACYVSDVANRLTGWVWAQSECRE